MPGYTLTATELSFNSASEAPSQRGVHGGYAHGYNYRLQPTFEPLQVRRPWQSLKFDTLSHSTTVGFFCVIAYAENLACNGGYDLPLWGPITSRLRPGVGGRSGSGGPREL
jgi:hypothetical protein